MNNKDKTKEELLIELQELSKENKSLTVLKGKRVTELGIANEELAFQNEEKEKRANELGIVNKELAFQNEEKEKRADELIIANKELAYQNELKEKRAAELIIANKELLFQNEEKEERAAEFIIANKELVHQNELKEKRAAELIIANKELSFQKEEKEKRAEELIIANKELLFQNEEKEKRAAEFIIANKELVHQNELKEKRAAELIIANKELLFQNQEKEKRAEELIKAKEQAEESDRLKSAFLANMSHEIRTPMNGILGFANLLKEPGLTGEEQQAFIRVIEKSGKRMLNIINDIISISKIESGLMKVNLQESNINKQIEFIHTFFKPQVEAKGMRFFIKNTLAAKKAFIKSDSEKIYAILTNLVKNAIKYTEEGTIELGYTLRQAQGTVGEPVITEQGRSIEPAELEFYVKDTGIGIPKDRQAAIFERFIQADISDKMALQGAGLGLSISKAYVEMLGGKIWVESDPPDSYRGNREGKGSIFYFTLPYRSEPLKKIVAKNDDWSEKADSVVNSEVSGLKILIAEDDETSEKLISIIVKARSKVLFKARTGIEAVDICRNNPDIDLILMDIQMPDLNGYDASRQIRKFNKDVVIIAQTAFGLTGDKEKAIESGCNDYISKPYNKTQLLALVQTHFKK